MVVVRQGFQQTHPRSIVGQENVCMNEYKRKYGIKMSYL